MKSKLTLLSHFYNEEYLLPWWLQHHKKIFDDAILINYESTDNSVNLIREICPHWKVINSRNKDFDALMVDVEIADYESKTAGFTICLNTTEFLLAPNNYKDYFNNNINDTCYGIHTFTMVDENINDFPTHDKSLILQKSFGFKSGGFRFLHNYKKQILSSGRHHTQVEFKILYDFNIFWYVFCPWNEDLKKRKLQIKNKMSENDKNRGVGDHHMMTIDQMEEQYLRLHGQQLKQFFQNSII